MTETLYKLLVNRHIPSEFIIFIVSSLPITELRGAIPIGLLVMKQPVVKTYLWAVLGNIAPVAPLLFLLEPVSNKLRRFKVWANFFDWLFSRTRKKAGLIEKFEALGLILFVAVPLPMTGAWTGCIAATLFKMRFGTAFSAICAGVIMAGLIVTFLSIMGKILI